MDRDVHVYMFVCVGVYTEIILEIMYKKFSCCFFSFRTFPIIKLLISCTGKQWQKKKEAALGATHPGTGDKEVHSL